MVRTTQTPSGETELDIPGLGTLKGLLYANGVRQFLGVPYARLAKRWTRSTLATSWPNDYHDGRDLGSQAPNPPEFRCTGDLTPIDTFAHLTEPEEDEASCLILNIVLPPAKFTELAPWPVMFYIHGGSFIFGGANRSIFDCVNLVSNSVAVGRPVIAINMNYRVGLGGFLASRDILEDMKKEGFEGVGNFGLTDQQTALEWVQKYVSSLGGDKDNVTVFGLSAGGISIGHLLKAKNPPVFHRAISMSGVEHTIPAMSLEEHEKIYQNLLEYFGIDSSLPDSLEKLRAVPQRKVADATLPVYNKPNVVSSPCDDGVFHVAPVNVDEYSTPPKWLKSYMVGDVRDEGEIFVRPLGASKDYNWFKGCYAQYMSGVDAEFILDLYGLKRDADYDSRMKFMKKMFGDCKFGILQRKNLQASNLPETYGYHFDVTSKVKNSFYGTSYHALDLQYVFLNMHDDLDDEDFAFGQLVSETFIRFAYGEAPWEPYHPNRKWGIFTADYKIEVRSEEDDDQTRNYSRWDKIEEMGLMSKFLRGCSTIRDNYV